jgi:hypothetical protein
VTETPVESGSAVRETMGEALEKGKETAQQGIEKAKESAGEARGVLTRQLDERSTMAGERANAFARTARRVAGEFRGEGDEETARLTEAAADRAERLASYLGDSSGDAFLRDLENFARRRPLLAAAGGFMIGVAASRFLKASAERRSRSGNGGVNGGAYADLAASSPAPAQPFGHAEGAL